METWGEFTTECILSPSWTFGVSVLRQLGICMVAFGPVRINVTWPVVTSTAPHTATVDSFA